MFFFASSFAQTTVQDSLLQEIAGEGNDTTRARLLIELAETYKRSDKEKQFQYANKAYHIVKHSAYDKLKVSSFYVLGNSYLNRDQPLDSALIYFTEGLALTEKIEYPEREADLYNGVGAFYHQTGIYDKAFTNYQKAIALSEKYGFRRRLCRSLNNMATILVYQDEDQKALHYYKQALEIARALDNQIYISALLSNIGIAYNELGEYELALENYAQALELRRSNNDKIGEVLTTCSMGNVYRRQGLYERGLGLQLEGLALAEKADFARGRAICIEGLTYTYFDWEYYTEAIEYAKIGLVLSEQANFLENQVDFKDILAKSYAALGNYTLAYQAQSDYLVLYDSLNGLEKLKQVQELETKYQLQQREALFQEKQVIQQDALKRRNVLIVVIIILLWLVSFLAVNYYRSSKQRQQHNEQLEQAVAERTSELHQSIHDLKETNQELENFAFIASHDLKEPLRSIISFNDLIQKKLKDQVSEEVEGYFSFVSNSGQQMYDLIESTLEYSRLGEQESGHELVDVNQVIEQAQESLKALMLQKGAVVESVSLPTIRSNSVQLYLIFKNLIENGIKYNESEKPTVNISYQNGSCHQFTIQDNGIGISNEFHHKVFQMFKRLHNRTEYAGSGLGLSIVNKVLQGLDGSITLDSEAGGGSTFTVRIPMLDSDNP